MVSSRLYTPEGTMRNLPCTTWYASALLPPMVLHGRLRPGAKAIDPPNKGSWSAPGRRRGPARLGKPHGGILPDSMAHHAAPSKLPDWRLGHHGCFAFPRGDDTWTGRWTASPTRAPQSPGLVGKPVVPRVRGDLLPPSWPGPQYPKSKAGARRDRCAGGR